MTNGKPVRIGATQPHMRVTLVNLKLPWLARILTLFTGELILAVQGNVQDIAVVNRAQAQDIFESSRHQKWVPYMESSPAAPPPLKGPLSVDNHETH